MNTSLPFVIGTGYVHNSKALGNDFPKIWLKQVWAACRTTPKIYVAQHQPYYPQFLDMVQDREKDSLAYEKALAEIEIINVGNLGHIHQLVKAETPYKDHQLCGWSASVMMLAMIAYNAEKDFVYVEQDCLLFGDIIWGIYREMNQNGWRMAYGRNKIMKAAQSLFIVRHKFIPDFVRTYLDLWPDTRKDRRCEDKFLTQSAMMPGSVGVFSFGLDRDRPLTPNAESWYVQQLSLEEIAELKQLKLI